ncbi:MAG: TonB-dependent receptor [Pseudomonadota bacterium]
MKTTSKSLLAGAAMVALTLAPGAAFANGAKYNFDIPAQELSQSLLDLSDRTGAPIVADGALVEGEQAPAIRGRMTPAEALKILLAPAGLTYERDRATIYRVIEPQPVIEIPGGASGAQIEKDEIIVTGTNIRTASHIRGAPTDSAPLFTYGSDDLDRSGYASADDFIQVQPSTFGPPSQISGFRVIPQFDDSGVFIGQRIVFNETSFQQNSLAIHGFAPLQLTNSRRDIFALDELPVTAIDRFEVLADGASAIYGDTAVSGVVNTIMRSEFDGAETTVRYGKITDSGAEEYLAAQTLGKIWGSGNALVTYEFLHRGDITFPDRGFVPANDPRLASSNIPISIFPEDQQHRIYGTFSQSVTDEAEVFLEGLASIRKFTENVSVGVFTPVERPPFMESVTREKKYSITLGGRYQFGGDWLGEVKVTRSAAPNRLQSFPDSTQWVATAKADGAVMELPGGAARLALGGEFRKSTSAVNRNIYSGFGEAFVPIIGAGNRMTGVERLEISAAGRFDHYENSGGVTSPRASILWSPVKGLNLRGSYGRSFYAPIFNDSPSASNFAEATILQTDIFCDTRITNCPSVVSTAAPTIVVASSNIDLPAARSTNWTFGADFTPAAVKGLTMSASYYDIEVTGRPFKPPFGFIPNLAELFPNSHSRTLTPEFIDHITPIIERSAAQFDAPFSDCVRFLGVPDQPFGGSVQPMFGGAPLIDGRCIRLSDAIATGNFAVIDVSLQPAARERTRGLDLSASYNFETMHGVFDLFAAANYVFTFERRLTEQTPTLDVVDSFGDPLDLRVRGGGAWRKGAFNVSAIINYADDYAYETFVDTTGVVFPSFTGGTGVEDVQLVPVKSMTTLDLYLAFDAGVAFDNRWLKGTTFAVTAINLTDERPQEIPGAALGFDDFNADPTGRFVAFQVTKTW